MATGGGNVVDRSAAADSDNRVVAEPERPSEYFPGFFQRQFAELGPGEQHRIKYTQDEATAVVEKGAAAATAKARRKLPFPAAAPAGAEPFPATAPAEAEP